MRVGLERGCAAALVVVMLAAGCAPTGAPSPSIDPGESLRSPTSRSPPASSGSETATDTAQPNGKVRVEVEPDRYAPGEPIQLRIENGLNDAITTVDQQAFCGVLRLDRAAGADWEEVHNCPSGPPPRDVVIGPGEAWTETWASGLETGVYRARLVYTIGAAFIAGEASEVISDRLTVD